MNRAKALWYYDMSNGSNHDKIHITIYDEDAGIITAYWGRRGASFQDKGKMGTVYAYEDLVNSKTSKGYEPITDMKMIEDLSKQLPAEHAHILLQAYGIASLKPSSPGSRPVPAVKAPVPKSKAVPPPTAKFSGGNTVVVCIKDDIEGFEKNIEYVCTAADGMTMKVINMFGEEVYVLPSTFKAK